MQSLRQDLRFALRLLGRSPGFTIAVVLSLALGIGANTAIFTLLDAVMWRFLPVKDPDTLLAAGRQQGALVHPGFTYSQYRLLHDNTPVASLAGYTTAPLNVSVDGPPEAGVQGQLVTGDYFGLLGVNAALGRAIGPEDDRAPNGHPVAMLSHGYWARRFARDPAVIGRTIRLSSVPFTIIGVTPPEFFGVEVGTAPDLFIPLMMQPTVMPAFENLLDSPIVNRTWVHTIVRTKPGVTRDQAAAALDAVFQTHPDNSVRGPAAKGPPAGHLALAPATQLSALRRQFSRPLMILLAIVGVVLLTACANTANLLLARAEARRPEIAVRMALGADRRRLLRQLLVESVLLALAGGIGGVLLSRWATALLLTFMSSGRTPLAVDLAPDLAVLTFTAAVSVATGLLFGLVPAWRATRLDLTPALKNVRRAVTRSVRPGRVLAIAQLALSLLLIVAAGLFVRSLQSMTAGDGASTRQSVVILRVEPRGSDQRNIPGTSLRLDRIYRELIARVETIPDVRLVSMAQVTPTAPLPNAGAPVRLSTGEQVRVPLVMVYPNYFATIGIPLVKGRDFGAGDLAEQSPAVCVVNETFVRQVYPAEDPLGKPCYMARRARLQEVLPDPPPPPPPAEPFLIVGVVRDSPYNNPGGRALPMIYSTFLQTGTGRGQMVLHARVMGNAGAVIQRIREGVVAVDPTVPMFDVHTLNEEMNAALVQQRMVALLSSLFGSLALVLASVGLYGLLAFSLVQRTSEIGLRMALGARRGSIAWLVVREALVLAGLGIAVGVPAALVAARLASSQIAGLLFGLDAADPATMAAASLVLVTVAVLAAWLPARRASRVDPIVALRAE
jgi:predicted permease